MNALQQVEVQLVDGRPMVSSLKVAGHFGKQHKDVLKAIKNLEIPEEFRERNFAPSEYEVETGIGQSRKYPMYLMTRDGFTLLAMGFTGKKAMEWKIRYIEAFNAMEKRLSDISKDMVKLTYNGEQVI
ncbi:Rha family transcriptional regulator, partial [Desulfovulcanus sp.]